MEREDSTISLTAPEIALLLAALTFFEMTFCKDSPENVVVLRGMRAKLIAVS